MINFFQRITIFVNRNFRFKELSVFLPRRLNSQSQNSSKNKDNEVKHSVQIQIKPTLGRLSFTSGNTFPIVVTPTTVKSSSVRSAEEPLVRGVIRGQDVTPSTINSKGRYNNKDLILY